MPDPDRTELIPDPFTLIRRVDWITNNLNELRNAVQGRGVQPIGSAALAERVNRAQLEWHDLRSRLLADDGRQLRDHPYDSSATLENWERSYNELVAAAIAEKVPGVDSNARLQVTHTDQALSNAAAKTTEAIGDSLGTFFKGLVIVAAVAGAAYVFANRRPQRGRAA
jgi:hypothetical protein